MRVAVAVTVALQCKKLPSSSHHPFGDIPKISLVWARSRDRGGRTGMTGHGLTTTNLFPNLDVS